MPLPIQTIFPYEINLYDLASCIDNNDNHVTFVGHIVHLCPLWHHLNSRSARAQMMLLRGHK